MRKTLLFIIVVLIGSGLIFNSACKKDDSDNQLTGTTWILETIQYSSQNIIQVENTFSMNFHEDEILVMVVDCNSCSATYSLGSNNQLTIDGNTACTEVDCGPDSLDDQFHAALATVSSYELDGSTLRLIFNNASSTLNFRSQ